MKNFKLLLAVLSVFLLSLGSCTTIETGETGFMKTFSDGVDPNGATFSDGTMGILPWNTMVTMETRQQSLKYDDVKLKDANQVILLVDYALSVQLDKDKAPAMYVKHGENYVQGYLDDIVSSAVKDVIGKYGYVEILGNKRTSVELEIADIIKEQFAIDSFLNYKYIQIKDVQLPNNIQTAINAKEEQEQINEKAEKKKEQERFIADARLEKARGDSALVISASYKAEAIAITSRELAKSPSYTNYIKWKGFADGKGSPYGTNNMFGGEAGVLVQK